MQREEEDATTIEIPSVVLETFDSRNKRHVRHMPGKLRHPREGFSLFKLFSLGCFCRESFILLLVLCSLQMIRPMVYLIEMDSHETGSLCLLNGDQRELISRWLILLFLSPLPSLVLLALLFVTHSQLFFAFKKSQYRCTCSWRFLWYYFLGRERELFSKDRQYKAACCCFRLRIRREWESKDPWNSKHSWQSCLVECVIHLLLLSLHPESFSLWFSFLWLPVVIFSVLSTSFSFF